MGPTTRTGAWASSSTRRAAEARAAAALVALLSTLPARGPAQPAPDTLVYSVAIRTRDPHLAVEARLSGAAGTLVLAAPPATGPARTRVAGFAATDDRGRALQVRRSAGGYVVQVPESGAVRFRYRLDLLHRAPEGSTGSGLDTTRLYAVTRSLFVAPDPTTFRKTGAPYPALVVEVLPPAGWQVVAGWPGGDGLYQPADGEELLGATLAAAPDFRARTGTAGGVSWHLAVRSDRYFADSLLAAVVEASLARAVAALGRVDVPRVTYIADEGRKGRTSGSLQGRSSIGLIWEPSEVLEAARAHDVFHETLHLWFGGAMEAERWWTEGVTDYVAARLLAEWRTEPELLAQLCYESLQHYRRIAHRFRLTMAQETREGIGGDNTELLVYRKGMLAGLLLDAAVRRGSGGRRTLDDASRALLALAAGRRNRNVTEAELRAAVEREGGAAAARTWQRVVAGTDALTEADLADALREVTGRHLPAPPELAKDRKQLRP